MTSAVIIALIVVGAITKHGWQAHIFAIALLLYFMAEKAGAL